MKSLSHIRLLVTPWTVAHHAPPSMGFSRQEYWSRVPLPSPSFNSVCLKKEKDVIYWEHKRKRKDRNGIIVLHLFILLLLGMREKGLTDLSTISLANDKRCVCVQSCLTLCDPMDCSPPDSSVHGIFQARIPEWVAISSFRASSCPRDRTHVSYVSCIDRQIVYY